MKLHSVSVAVLAALSSASIGLSAAQAASAGPLLQPMAVPSAEARSQLQRGAKARQLDVRQNNGQNLTIARRTPADKFQPEAGLTGEQQYIVELFGDTVLASSQRQAVAQGEQTQSLKGSQLQAPAVVAAAYQVEQLQADVFQQSAALLGRPLDIAQQYTTVINGFSTRMTQQEALKLAELGAVKRISRVKVYQLATDAGPALIKADKVWTGQTVANKALQGEGVVVGILDTGINTDHASFQPVGADGYQVINPLGAGQYLGDCANNQFADRCNDKLIGVFSYKQITDAYKATEFQDPAKPHYEPNIAIRPAFGEDYNGHGSHVASTAAGNVLTDVPLQGNSGAVGDGVDTGFRFSQISGVAPHANVVAFQVCWPGSSGDPYAGCPGDVLIAAVEDAVKAGVDVINFSIGGSEDSPWESALEQAFLAAHDAGVTVAAAAGNSGTDGNGEIMGQIDHSSPWLMNVAASSHDRIIAISGKTLTGFSGGEQLPETITGASISGEVSGPVVLAANFGDAKCLEPFPAGTFSQGEIVVCERGENARVAKAGNVLAGGAAGFVLYNTSWDSSSADGMTFNDVYPLPGIHIDTNAGSQLLTWLATGTDHKATITAATIARQQDPQHADMLANFSSRGPSTYVTEHLIPMIAAPGVNIFAANADDQPFTAAPNASDFTTMSGTSMASPHVAGAMALVRQAHPDWSPSEVQNALQMTSVQTLRYKPFEWSDAEPAGIYRAGSGRIDVQRAINSGLLMHETVQNFAAADPANGGAVRQLNMPELVNMNCSETCSWIRTFEATQDGDWSVESATGEVSFELKATPARFSLKKGQKISVMFEAKILDSQSNSHNSEQEIHGSVRLVPQQPNTPAVYLPVAVKYNHGVLPEKLQVTMNRGEGRHQVNDWALPELKSATYSAAAPVKGEVRQVTLPQDTDFCGFACDHVISDAEDVTLLDVPANTARLIVEVLKRTDTTADKKQLWNAGDADVFIGMDLNGDGIPQWDTEAICMSISEEVTDYCNINNPAAGKYWVVVHNFIHDSSQRIIDSYQVATAIVPATSGNTLTLTGPAQTDGLTKSDLLLNWKLPQSATGEVYYSMLNIGSSSTQPANIAKVPLKLMRGDDDIALSASQQAARAGQIIDMQLDVMANLDGYDRSLALKSKLPAHLTLIPGSVKVPAALQKDLKVEGNGFSLNTTQPNSLDWPRSYKLTTNKTDAMCKVPDLGQANKGGYVDLAQFGFYPQTGGDWNDNVVLDLGWYYGGDVKTALYNNLDHAGSSNLTLSPMGYLQLDQMPLFFPQHASLPFDGFPDQLVAPLWRGVTVIDGNIDWGTLRTPLNVDIWNPQNTSGMSMGFTADGQMVMEWDNARSSDSVYDEQTGTSSWQDRGDMYDFEIIYNLNYRHGEGQYEIVMAYDNIEFGNEAGAGSIGVKGYEGFRASFGPAAGYLGTQFALDDLRDKVTDGLVTCYDYQGPETSAFQLSFQVRVNNAATGTVQPVQVEVTRDGQASDTLVQPLDIRGNLKLGELSDLSIAEDTELKGLQVVYSDDNNVANTISVTGDNISATVQGHTSGSLINVKPAKDFSGTTTVTVTVTDNEHPSDKVSTSFKLTVTAADDAPVAAVAQNTLSATAGDAVTLDASSSKDADGDTLTYSWSGPGTIANANAAKATVTGLSAGSHVFTVTVSDGKAQSTATVTVTVAAAPVTTTPEPAKSSSGGSFGWWSLLLLGLLRRSR
ncbi:S8 family serine peptidase [Rheinheimera sp. F8]|uniref:S8 family serine peptidase n=1 Tax=Rheinheimera sp. F8 TaxID=1763998 RepID=UPI0007449A68|nr:S8 family serine peptidase [Rheinheimera sp. F8]ALZ77300.1 hypothetical protein ATY27_17065 [Rheinheimera sp. F8]